MQDTKIERNEDRGTLYVRNDSDKPVNVRTFNGQQVEVQPDTRFVDGRDADGLRGAFWRAALDPR